MDNYDIWKQDLLNNPNFQKTGDVLVNKKEFETAIKYNTYDMIRDIILLVIIIFVVILASIYIFYPENYKSTISSICAPTFNYTERLNTQTNNNNNNQDCFCNNTCVFPSKIRLEVINVTN